MSERAPPPSSRRPLKTARLGEHPAVKAYRAKLDSVSEGAAVAMTELDRSLQEFLADLKTTVRT